MELLFLTTRTTSPSVGCAATESVFPSFFCRKNKHSGSLYKILVVNSGVQEFVFRVQFDGDEVESDNEKMDKFYGE